MDSNYVLVKRGLESLRSDFEKLKRNMMDPVLGLERRVQKVESDTWSLKQNKYLDDRELNQRLERIEEALFPGSSRPASQTLRRTSRPARRTARSRKSYRKPRTRRIK